MYILFRISENFLKKTTTNLYNKQSTGVIYIKDELTFKIIHILLPSNDKANKNAAVVINTINFTYLIGNAACTVHVTF